MDKSDLIDFLESIEADLILLHEAIDKAQQSYSHKSGTHATFSMIQTYLRNTTERVVCRVEALQENGFSQ